MSGMNLSFKRKDLSFEYYFTFTVYEVNSLLTRITLALDYLSGIGDKVSSGFDLTADFASVFISFSPGATYKVSLLAEFTQHL